MQFAHFTIDTSTASVSNGSNHYPTLAYKEHVNYNPTMIPVTANATPLNTIYCSLPAYFIHSRDAKKEIQLLIFRAFDLEGGYEIQATLHSDIASIDASADHYIASSNTLYSVPKSYKIGDNRSMFQMWLRDLNGNLLDLDTTKLRVIIELVLSY